MALIDSGSSVNIISDTLHKQLWGTQPDHNVQ